MKLDLAGNVVGHIEGAGQGKTLGKYGEAHYIALSPRGEIFVADTLNWRVQKYVRVEVSRTRSGALTSLAPRERRAWRMGAVIEHVAPPKARPAPEDTAMERREASALRHWAPALRKARMVALRGAPSPSHIAGATPPNPWFEGRRGIRANPAPTEEYGRRSYAWPRKWESVFGLGHARMKIGCLITELMKGAHRFRAT